jgi:hypothetical protein
MARGYVSIMLAISLTTTSSPGVTPVGVISHADRAHVGVGTASAGTTLYEGDRLTTETGGEVWVRSGSVALQLQQQTSLTLASVATGEKGIDVDLGSGTVIFSTDGGSAVVVRANGATIRAADDTPMIAHVRVVGPKELRIFAQRGALDFSYRDQQEIIAEGACYRVLLNTPNDDPGGSEGGGAPQGKTGVSHKLFILIAIAAGAAAAAVNKSHHPHPHPHESPERP